ncbi:bh protein [Paenalkalicoccus suaedae]|uniref:Bh protein n=1 Tax=Paenalkalicoccus suaedae TaxID=2592382 RepID=A0A859FJ39_9BACI|nr:bh protein [Paenalkalicoccus suaedae]QKS72456.1 bh protein [Paenalkalicoccus suaedae]
MIINHVEADLYCIDCKEETPHEIVYVQDKISYIRCLECERAIEIDRNLMHEYGKHMYRSIANKPKQFTEEYRQDLSNFLFKLPVRIISKPYRFAKDFTRDVKEIRRYKHEHKEK